MHDYSRDIMLSKTQEQIELKVISYFLKFDLNYKNQWWHICFNLHLTSNIFLWKYNNL